MLITTCVHCRARFRVTPQQLNAKQGQVRCGRCRSVFNGFESLERFPDDDTGARLLAAREAAERATQIPPPVDPLPFDDLPDIETLEAAVTASVESAPSYVEPPAPVSSSPMNAMPPSRQKRAPRTPVEEVTLAPAPRAKRPARAWAFGASFLALALALELAFVFRANIAQRYPVVRPYLESACATARCTVPWPREETSLKLEESDLLEVPGKPNEIALGARIRNLAPVAQEYPHLELTLTDLTGQAAIRRVLRPADYLGRPVTAGDTLAAGSELSVQLRLETPRIKASGYELLLFYP